MADILAAYAPHVYVLTSAVLADTLDGLSHRQTALPLEIRPLKPEWKVFGRVATLSAVPVTRVPANPYAVELECIDALRPGDVLVATTNGERTSALWGELLSTACWSHGVAGVVLEGLTRDAAKIMRMNYPVFAAGCSPLDSRGRLECVHHGRPLHIGRCVVRPGDYVFGDLDGVILIPAAVAEQALPLALAKIGAEETVRAELAGGRSARDVFARHRIL